MRLAAASIVLMLSGRGALAHAIGGGAAEGPTSAPLVLALLIAMATLLYAAGLRRIRRQAGLRVVARAQSLAFGAGMAVLVLILLSPLDAYADALFCLHMVQHLLLTLAVPPLLVWSRPALVMLWGFPRGMRKPLGTAWHAGGIDRLVAALMHPLVVGFAFSAAFAFWHLPQPYAWALGNDWAHALEHATMFAAALMFWSLVIEPSGRRRMGFAATVVFVTATAVVSGFPGALMLLSPEPLYPVHAAGAAAWGLTPLEDQQLAGLIMWVPVGLLYLAPIAWLFIKLLSDRGRPRAPAGGALSILIVALLPLALAACSDATPHAAGGEAHAEAKALMARFGCGACHQIPGIAGADGRVGPPLGGIADRLYLAGALPNTPDNMERWLSAPQAVVPGNAMPDVGATPKEARVMAAYLATLHR